MLSMSMLETTLDHNERCFTFIIPKKKESPDKGEGKTM